jgi:hypothetical protein
MKKPRYFPIEAKRSAVRRVAAGEAVSTVARDIGAGRGRLYLWYRSTRRVALRGCADMAGRASKRR